MVRRGPLIAAIAVAVLALMTSPARAVPCADVAPYPGDGAPRSAIAQWMAYGASVAAIPRELPVMAALVESGLANLHQADVDSVGYFQMRVGIWNRGEYAGYPDSPPLQLKWFVDQAAAVRKQRLAAGAPEPSTDVAHWGDWIADAVLAPESFRGRYQLRIDEARALVGEPCTPPAAGRRHDPARPAARLGEPPARAASRRDRRHRAQSVRAVHGHRERDDRPAAPVARAEDRAAPARPDRREHPAPAPRPGRGHPRADSRRAALAPVRQRQGAHRGGRRGGQSQRPHADRARGGLSLRVAG
jgi:hypothetical protein